MKVLASTQLGDIWLTFRGRTEEPNHMADHIDHMTQRVLPRFHGLLG